MPITHALIWQRAWPIILANAAVPLLGLADTAIIGNLGTTEDLGAIALGALIFSLVYWSFGFLRMGTTGFTAQANGAGDEAEVRSTLVRALGLGGLIGIGLLLLQWPIHQLVFRALDGSQAVETIASDYFSIRIWGAPATLGIFAIMGCLIGLGLNRHVLLIQLFLNSVNIVLDFIFAGPLGMGAQGIALGTAIAEWSTLVLGLIIALRLLRHRFRQHQDTTPFLHWASIVDPHKVKATLAANSDIMIRTVFMLGAFFWFTNQGARFGDDILAANHILLQFISFSAFFLDGFAFVAEAIVGSAIGARSRHQFNQAVRYTSHLAIASAAALALGLLLGGDSLIKLITQLPDVQAAASEYLPWAALYILLSVGAFQLDGIFIGATRTAAMRNASIMSVMVFLLACWPLATHWHNHGLWCAFVIYVSARAASLLVYYPSLAASLKTDHPAY